MFKAIFLFLFLLITTSSFAGQSPGGTVKMLLITSHEDDIVMFDVGAHHNKPDCSVIGDEWALSLKTEYGRAMYALLLSAAAQKQTVIVYGEGACNAWVDRESPRDIYIRY